MLKRIMVISIASVLVVVTVNLTFFVASSQADFPDVCADDPGNLIHNCKFNDGLDNWRPFLVAGTEPDFGTVTGSNCHSPDCPSLYVEAKEWFVGGVYQQVSGVKPGAYYWANVIWLTYDPAGALDNTVGRRIGIDPTGGTQPNSPNVVWSQDVWVKFDDCPYKICQALQVEAEARNTTITVFVRIEDTWKNRPEEFPQIPAGYFDMTEKFWIDDVGMKKVPPPTPTPTLTPSPTPTTTPTPKPVSTQVSPDTGGILESNDANRSTTVIVPPGAVKSDTIITYAHRTLTETGELQATGYTFDLSAAQNGVPIRRFARPVTISVRYEDQQLGTIAPGTLGLYWMATDTSWLGLDQNIRRDQLVTGTTDHFTLFALLGQPAANLFLPLIWK